MAIAEPSTVIDIRDMSRTRRTRTWAFSVAVTVVVAATASSDWAAVLVVMPSLLLAVLVLLRVDEEPNWLWLSLTVVVGLPTLLWSALTGANPTGSVSLAVAAGVVIEARTTRRAAWATAAGAAVAGVSTVALTTDSPNAVGTVVQLTFVAAIWLCSIHDMGSERRLFALLEGAKDVERELSLARERHRFAADLHDIQGHTLHVIKLKAAVAAKLRTADPARAAQELEAIQQLTAQTITAARELAADRHALRFSEELHSAVDLLDAVGATTTVQRPDGTPASDWETTLARVLRESTTNILRHARPEHVSIVVGADHLVVTNDGAPARQESCTLRGLDTLHRRLRALGGGLELRDVDGTFTLEARMGQVRDC